jgi:hypothetical protein
MFVPAQLPSEKVDEVEAMHAAGLSDYEVARQTGVARSTIQRWRKYGPPNPRPRTDALPRNWRPDNELAYSYLLGMFLGDGTVTQHPRTMRLQIVLDAAQPWIAVECAIAIARVLPIQVSVYRRTDENAVVLSSYTPMWALVFPQWGKGPKHKRAIELESWQSEICRRYPRQLIRGLIHSDGSRCINRFRTTLPSGRIAEYEYTRYFFTNYSADIRGIFCHYCDLLGIRWTQSSHRNVSISHRDSVAVLDSFVGPKR